MGSVKLALTIGSFMLCPFRERVVFGFRTPDFTWAIHIEPFGVLIAFTFRGDAMGGAYRYMIIAFQAIS